jgi:fused signal recognition particle receptor
MYRKICFLAAFITLLVIVLGAYVRLSDAGLGCPDWPGCYGRVVVSDSVQFKVEAATDFPQNPVDTGKAWKEMSHRYLAGFLSLLVLSLLPFALRLKQQATAATVYAISLLVLIALQAALGMWTVNLKVMPVVVTSHLLLGFITFWVLSWVGLRFTPGYKYTASRSGSVWLVLLGMLVLFVQIALGGWVSSNYAALACSDFPRCNGLWLPDADFSGALDVFHGLLNGDSSRLAADAQLAVHWLHRLGAVVSFVVLSLVMLSATDAENPRSTRRAGVLLSALLMVQLGLGIFNIKYALPLWSAVAHTAVAGLLMLPLLIIYFFSRYRPEETQSELEPTVIAKQTIEVVEQPSESLFLRLKTQLKKTRGSLGGVLSTLMLGQKPGSELLKEVEASLIMADLGMETTTDIIRHLNETLDADQRRDGEVLIQTLKQNLYDMLLPCSLPLQIPKQDGPFVILVVGVNGAGKTTSIGKLAHRLQAQGHSVMLAAGDTFRAAAVEQLQAWGERNNVQVIAQHSGADSASVIFDALQSAKAKGVDVLIADTAGRLHTKSNLMDELTKIKRIMAKLDAAAPHEVLLILDAGTGQNALSQARLFNEAVQLTGLALTKLDGTAKGGVIFALANQLHVPIRFIGVGEGIEDLQDFDAASFIDALFAKD